MVDPIPSCFRGSITGVPPASTTTGPSLTTSIYETHLGQASFTWSRTVLGLSLRADLRLTPSSSEDFDDDDYEDKPFSFRIRPWLFWKRKGSQRIHTVDVAWDLTSARFSSTGGPEPSSKFFVAVALDGEMLLVAGDMVEDAHRKMKTRRRTAAIQIIRKEHALFKGGDMETGGRREYRTAVTIWGREREIGFEICGTEKEASGMCVSIDATKILQIRRLRWKFRGRERVEIDGNRKVQISWDLHSWLFPTKENTLDSGEISQAILILRFERDDEVSDQNEKEFAAEELGGLRKSLMVGEKLKVREKKSLVKTSSSSSSSSTSSAASSSVMEWASPEEAELRGNDGFTLVVYAWKS